MAEELREAIEKLENWESPGRQIEKMRNLACLLEESGLNTEEDIKKLKFQLSESEKLIKHQLEEKGIVTAPFLWQMMEYKLSRSGISEILNKLEVKEKEIKKGKWTEVPKNLREQYENLLEEENIKGRSRKRLTFYYIESY